MIILTGMFEMKMFGRRLVVLVLCVDGCGRLVLCPAWSERRTSGFVPRRVFDAD